jgi:hypothetical protein
MVPSVWLHSSRRLYPAGDAHRPGSCDRFVRGCEPQRALCVSQMRAEIARELVKINQYGMAACPSCGAPMVSASDVLREVEVLK